MALLSESSSALASAPANSSPTPSPTPWKARSAESTAASGQSERTSRTSSQQTIVVQAAPVISAYGAPPEFSQSRFGPLTNAYVLPAGAVYTSVIYENDSAAFRKPDNTFTQELEIGLPYRFNVAAEHEVQYYDGTLQETGCSLEARYAFADWNKIPLNPTFFTELKFGVGNILHDEGAPTPGRNFGPGGFDTTQHLPDSSEMRLLLSQEFFGKIEWALNSFFEQELGGDRGREWGLAQSIETPVILPNEALKVGIEAQFRSFSDNTSRGQPYNSVVVGPTAGWKPTRNTRLDISPFLR